ncbi:MAG: hypothetical protein U0174_16335 [Polyangiaceae bacterium]
MAASRIASVARFVAALVLSVLPNMAKAEEPFPDYPFPEEYVVPKSDEVGTASGQLRLHGLLGGAYVATLGDRHGSAVALTGVTEGMLTSVVGLRATGFASIPFEGPQVFSARLGPSLHFLPYRRFDLGLFFDGGFATLDLFRANRTLLPVVGSGLTVDYAISNMLSLHGEFSGQVGIADQGAARVLLVGSATLGIVVMF